jgi:hypothetical protein
MGISETLFWSDVEAAERRHQKSQPTKPRSACVEAARAVVEAIDRERSLMESRLRDASDRLAGLTAEAPELVPLLDVSNSKWREVAGDRVLSATSRSEMARVRDRGAAAITADIEAWWRQKRAAAEAEVARAESMPVDDAEEEAWRQWSERCSSEINRMHDEYAQKGCWQ